jgi:uncharacterized tellurite resistance protein B-like protein
VFTRLLRKLKAISDHVEPEQAKPVWQAVADLLLEVSRADFEVHETELKTARELLKDRFELSDEQTARALDLALEESERSISIYPLLRTINDRLTPEEKASVIEALWKMAYADGKVDAHEEHRIRRIADLLYVPHRTYIHAKHLAEKLVQTAG